MVTGILRHFQQYSVAPWAKVSLLDETVVQ